MTVARLNKVADMPIKQRWAKTQDALRRMRFDRSPAVPKNLHEYIDLMREIAQDTVEHEEEKMKTAAKMQRIDELNDRRPAQLLSGITIDDGRVGVLGEKTIWSPNWTPEPGVHPQALWPNAQEFKEEGDERFTSSYGRFFPIPRVPGNDTVVFKQRAILNAYPMDSVMPVPRLCPVVIPFLYGFEEPELDQWGIPYDDDEVPGGSVAIAYHLDDDDKNLENASAHKLAVYIAFLRTHNDQVFGATKMEWPPGEEGLGDPALLEYLHPLSQLLDGDSDEESDFGSEGLEMANGARNKSFSMDPTVKEFVSKIATPSDIREETPLNLHGSNNNAVDRLEEMNAQRFFPGDAESYEIIETLPHGLMGSSAATDNIPAPRPKFAQLSHESPTFTKLDAFRSIGLTVEEVESMASNVDTGSSSATRLNTVGASNITSGDDHSPKTPSSADSDLFGHINGFMNGLAARRGFHQGQEGHLPAPRATHVPNTYGYFETLESMARNQRRQYPQDDDIFSHRQRPARFGAIGDHRRQLGSRQIAITPPPRFSVPNYSERVENNNGISGGHLVEASRTRRVSDAVSPKTLPANLNNAPSALDLIGADMAANDSLLTVQAGSVASESFA